MLLRPWRLDDAPALVAAWADEHIQRWTGVPERRDLAAANHWIIGDEARRARWLSVDLVAELGGEVAGEVGLSTFEREAGTAVIGWWTAPPHRGHGVASTAARLVVRWGLEDLGLAAVVAHCQAANPASIAVAGRAGLLVMPSTDDAEVLLRAV